MIIDSNGNPLSTLSANSLDAVKVEIDWNSTEENQPLHPESISNSGVLDQNQRLLAHPNPFSQKLTIEYNFPIDIYADLLIVNALGQKFWESPVDSAKNVLMLDTHSWPKGIYFVKVQTEEESYIYKLIKKS